MIKSNNLFKNISLFLCLVPMFLLSLFCFIPKRDIHSVSALSDQVITNFNFIGSNFTTIMSSHNFSNNSADRLTVCNLNLSFGVEDGIYRASVDGVANTSTFSFYRFSGLNTRVSNAEDVTSTTNFLYAYDNGNTSHGYLIRVFHSGQLTSDIIKVVFSSYQNTLQNVFRPAPYYNTITYYDSNGEYMQFELPLYITDVLLNEYLFEERTYYFTTSFNDNAYYQAGYYDGYVDGMADGENLGYQDGYNNGVDVGYNNGYNDGVTSANDYSFLSLLGAVIDAPVSAFTGLLNFNLLGFNMLAFVTGLITLAVILFIVKLFIGGK